MIIFVVQELSASPHEGSKTQLGIVHSSSYKAQDISSFQIQLFCFSMHKITVNMCKGVSRLLEIKAPAEELRDGLSQFPHLG